MSILKKYQNKEIAIYGMGITGCSAARELKRLKAKIYCWDDDKKIRNKAKKENFILNKFWLNQKNIDKIVISPGIDIHKSKIKNYLKKNFNKIITDLDLFFELNKKAKIISITGTNGKSTTCKIIEKILKTAKYNVKVAGNIGTPILSLDKLKKNYVLILEASSYQLQYSKIFRSQHAAILNISPDHLERHKNLKNYIKAKSKIFLAQKKNDFSYINSKSKYFNFLKKIFKLKKIKSKLVIVNNNKCKFLLKKINNEYLKKEGNIENLAFAYKIAKNLKVSDKIIIKALNKFKGLPHRQETIFLNNKILCVNDSKATSFEATSKSLSNYNNIYWIVGGLPKYGDHFSIKNFKNKIIKAYVIGKNTNFFVEQIKKELPFTISKNIKNALNNIYKDLKLSTNFNNTILLSPAAASFDQFNNFENRGIFFKKLIMRKFNQKKNV